MSSTLDAAKDVREGEELDVEVLGDYLREQLDEFDPDLALHIKQFRSGHSNLTYLLRFGDEDQEDVPEYVLRRPPFGAEKIKRGHDMSREWRVLSALEGHYSKIPRPVLFCEDHDILGCDFYLMERVRGIILRGGKPTQIELNQQNIETLDQTFVDAMVELHNVDLQSAGLDDLGKPQGYATRQIEGWTERYHRSKTDAIPEMDMAAAWLADHLPAEEQPPALIHNDFKHDNIVLDPDDISQVLALLDWEMTTIGDPRMDLGSTLAYWVQPDDDATLQMMQFGPTSTEWSITRAELAARWSAQTERPIDDLLFFYIYGLFKLAVIAQQIYYRFAQGYTQDQRFAMFIHAVRALAEKADLSIQQDSV